MANIPGTSGPVDYPNRPEGGAEGGTLAGPPLPGGTARYPEAFPATVEPQQGAGVPGVGGLTPNPGEPTSGTVHIGWKGDGYANAAPPVVDATQGLMVAQTESGQPGVSPGPGTEGGVDNPTTFTPL